MTLAIFLNKLINIFFLFTKILINHIISIFIFFIVMICYCKEPKICKHLASCDPSHHIILIIFKVSYFIQISTPLMTNATPRLRKDVYSQNILYYNDIRIFTHTLSADVGWKHALKSRIWTEIRRLSSSWTKSAHMWTKLTLCIHMFQWMFRCGMVGEWTRIFLMFAVGGTGASATLSLWFIVLINVNKFVIYHVVSMINMIITKQFTKNGK